MSSATSNKIPHTTGSSAGATVGDKVKGAFQAVHGAGERLRGNALDAADTATGDRTAADTGGVGVGHGTGMAKGAQNVNVDAHGRAEQAEGMDRLAQ